MGLEPILHSHKLPTLNMVAKVNHQKYTAITLYTKSKHQHFVFADFATCDGEFDKPANCTSFL